MKYLSPAKKAGPTAISEEIVVGFRAGFALRRFRNLHHINVLRGSKSAERRLSEGSPPTALKPTRNCHPLSLAEYVGNFAPIGGRASHCEAMSGESHVKKLPYLFCNCKVCCEAHTRQLPAWQHHAHYIMLDR